MPAHGSPSTQVFVSRSHSGGRGRGRAVGVVAASPGARGAAVVRVAGGERRAVGVVGAAVETGLAGAALRVALGPVVAHDVVAGAGGPHERGVVDLQMVAIGRGVAHREHDLDAAGQAVGHGEGVFDETPVVAVDGVVPGGGVAGVIDPVPGIADLAVPADEVAQRVSARGGIREGVGQTAVPVVRVLEAKRGAAAPGVLEVLREGVRRQVRLGPVPAVGQAVREGLEPAIPEEIPGHGVTSDGGGAGGVGARRRLARVGGGRGRDAVVGIGIRTGGRIGRRRLPADGARVRPRADLGVGRGLATAPTATTGLCIRRRCVAPVRRGIGQGLAAARAPVRLAADGHAHVANARQAAGAGRAAPAAGITAGGDEQSE